MAADDRFLIELEQRFWQSIVEQDADTELGLLTEPAVMVSRHGAMTFGHDDYRRMFADGPQVLKAFQLNDFKVVFPDENTAVLAYRARQTVAPRGHAAGDAENEIEEMNDSSTWVRSGDSWRCVLHTETPAG